MPVVPSLSLAFTSWYFFFLFVLFEWVRSSHNARPLCAWLSFQLNCSVTFSTSPAPQRVLQKETALCGAKERGRRRWPPKRVSASGTKRPFPRAPECECNCECPYSLWMVNGECRMLTAEWVHEWMAGWVWLLILLMAPGPSSPKTRARGKSHFFRGFDFCSHSLRISKQLYSHILYSTSCGFCY